MTGACRGSPLPHGKRSISSAQRCRRVYASGFDANREAFSIRLKRSVQSGGSRAKNLIFIGDIDNGDQRFWYYVIEVCSFQRLQKRKSMSIIASRARSRSARPPRSLNDRCDFEGTRASTRFFHSSSRHQHCSAPAIRYSEVHGLTQDANGMDQRKLQCNESAADEARQPGLNRSLICRRQVGKARRGANRGHVQQGHQRRK